MRIVFRDAHLLVVDKPAGLASQSTRDREDNVFDRIRRDHPRAALHHRLDQPASGLLLLSIDPSVNGAITDMFRSHAIDRVYAAVLAAPVEATTWRWKIGGQDAVTHVTPIAQGGGFTAVECRLETGRTHQIRLHATTAGAPIVGDRQYGGDAGRWWPRLALHARKMGFRHPVSGERIELESEIPGDLRVLWERVGGDGNGTG